MPEKEHYDLEEIKAIYSYCIRGLGKTYCTFNVAMFPQSVFSLVTKKPKPFLVRIKALKTYL